MPSIEGTLKTQRRAIPVFQFVLAVAEVSMYLMIRHFVWYSEEKVQQMLKFRRELACALINNPCHTPAPQYVIKTRAKSNPLTLTSCLLAGSTLVPMTGATSFLVPLIPTISSPVRQLDTPNR